MDIPASAYEERKVYDGSLDPVGAVDYKSPLTEPVPKNPAYPTAVAQRTLFSILTDQHWAVSLLVAGAVYAVGAMFSPLIAGAAALPFIGVAGYVVWLRLRRGPALDVPALLKALRSASPDDMRAMLAEVYTRERYEVADGASGDLELQRNGYVTLVRFRRWRAQSTNPGAVTELRASMQARSVDHGVYITTGTATGPARKQADASGITLIDGMALAELVKRTAGARQALKRARQEAAKA
jgi:hypothetical protein